MRAGRIIAGTVSAVAVGGIITAAALLTGGATEPTPAATPVTVVDRQAVFQEAADTIRTAAETRAAADEAARVAAEQAAAEQAAAAAAEAARVEAERVAVEQAAAEQAEEDPLVEQPQVETPVVSGPIRCPAGSQANSGDAGNDTSCLPAVCFTIVLPNPAYPECERPFKP